MSKRHRQHWTAPACSSGKASFRSQGRAVRAAVQHLGEAKQSMVAPVAVPRGVYHCRCGAWHWTSRPRPDTVLLPGVSATVPGEDRGAADGGLRPEL